MANVILESHFGTTDFENDDRDWVEWLDTLVHELRAAMLTRREGARVVAGAHPDVATTLIKLWDLTVRVLHTGGFSYGKAVIIGMTVINFTFGWVIEEQASPPYSKGPDIPIEEAFSMLRSFEAMAAAMDAWKVGDNDARFDMAVRIIINGVRAEERT
jgi:TetR/AcrR family tetracycline transcriptional repressor